MAVLRPRVILKCRLHEPPCGLREVRGPAVACLTPEAQPVGALGIAVSSRPAVPLDRLGKVLRDA